MRQVILFIATSLDGYIARTDGGIDWLFTDQDYGYAAFSAGIDTVIMGRKTYEKSLSFGGFPYTGKECYVFTRNPNRGSDDRVVFLEDDPAELVRRLRSTEGKNIWLVGGADLIRDFVLKDLIDTYVVSIHPIILGAGIPLFQSPLPSHHLVLHDTTTFNSGLVQLTYTRKR